MPEINGLLTANEMSAKLNGVLSAERILELVESKIMPHYLVGEQVLFGISETKQWLNRNYCVKIPGKELGDSICSIVNVVEPVGEKAVPPLSLRAIAGWLIPMGLESVKTAPFSGVYFLCHEGEVVYVGQSGNLLSRVGQHFGDKTFSSVFFVRIPKSDLDYVEGNFIKLLKPKYNHTKLGRLVGPSCCVKPGSAESERLLKVISNAAS